MRVNEIFYSLQGEGRWTGTPAVFLRLSGCNLRCGFCDTRHEDFTEMSEDEIVGKVATYASRHIVITGGEPSLQLTQSLVDRLHENGFFVQIETNGSHRLPGNVDWITCSPKDLPVVLDRVDELKVVFTGEDLDEGKWDCLNPVERRVQPCDVGDRDRNAAITAGAVEWCLRHPRWRLSLQTHKLLDIR